MILAAGAGTRLRPLTDRIPKALIEVGGRPLLGWVMESLVRGGINRVVVNAHHHEDRIRTYLRENAPPNVRVGFSPEPDGPYDTGGGLFAAARFFRYDWPFILHNVDVLSDIPMDWLLDEHMRARGRQVATPDRPMGKLLASVAVQARDSSRQLLFDDQGLMGWENRGSKSSPPGSHLVREPIGELARYSFTGIHVLESDVFRLSQRSGAFSIITLYLELAKEGWVIEPVVVSSYNWMDVGTPERLEEARRLYGP